MNMRVIHMYIYICIYRLETQTGVNVAVLRQNFFLREAQFGLLRPSTDGVKLTCIIEATLVIYSSLIVDVIYIFKIPLQQHVD